VVTKTLQVVTTLLRVVAFVIQQVDVLHSRVVDAVTQQVDIMLSRVVEIVTQRVGVILLRGQVAKILLKQ